MQTEVPSPNHRSFKKSLKNSAKKTTKLRHESGSPKFRSKSNADIREFHLKLEEFLVGHLFKMTYQFEIPLFSDRTVRVQFEDSLFQVSETQILNRARISKFGVHLGDMICSFQKLSH